MFFTSYSALCLEPETRLERVLRLDGRSFDQAQWTAVDGARNVYIAGLSDSTDFPVTQSIGNPGSARRGFIAKFASAASAPLWVSAFPLESSGELRGLTVDPSGRVSFATLRAGGSTVTTLSEDGSRVLAEFQASTANIAEIQGLALDRSNNSVLLYGRANGGIFPPSQFLNANGTSGLFVARLAPGLRAIEWARRLPDGVSTITSAASLENGEIALTGVANPNFSSTAPLPREFFGETQGNHIFALKFNPGADSLRYAVAFGGTGGPVPSSIALTPSGEAIITGRAHSNSSMDPLRAFPLSPRALSTEVRERAGFITVLAADGSSLSASSLLPSADAGLCAGVDERGRVWVIASTRIEQFQMPAVEATRFLQFNETLTELLQSSSIAPAVSRCAAQNSRISLVGPGFPDTGAAAAYIVAMEYEPVADFEVDAGSLILAPLQRLNSSVFRDSAQFRTRARRENSFDLTLPFIMRSQQFPGGPFQARSGTTPETVESSYNFGQYSTSFQFLSEGAANGFVVVPAMVNTARPSLRVTPDFVDLPAGNVGIVETRLRLEALSLNSSGVLAPIPAIISAEPRNYPNYLSITPEGANTPEPSSGVNLLLRFNTANLPGDSWVNLYQATVRDPVGLTTNLQISVRTGFNPDRQLIVEPNPFTLIFNPGDLSQSKTVSIRSRSGEAVPLNVSAWNSQLELRLLSDTTPPTTPAQLIVTGKAMSIPWRTNFDDQGFTVRSLADFVQVNVTSLLLGPAPPLELQVDCAEFFNSFCAPGSIADIHVPAALLLPEAGFRDHLEVRVGTLSLPILDLGSQPGRTQNLRKIRVQLPVDLIPRPGLATTLTLMDRRQQSEPIGEGSFRIEQFQPRVENKLDQAGFSLYSPKDLVILKVSGFGKTYPHLATGALPEQNQLVIPANPIRVHVGGKEAKVLDSRLSFDEIGVLLIAAEVPWLRDGRYSVLSFVGTKSADHGQIDVRNPSQP